MSLEKILRIGVISNTHGLYDESITSLFRGVDAIIHAGDIGRLEVIDRLEAIAPVIAVEGNNDAFRRFPSEKVEEFAGRRVLVTHIFGELHQIRREQKKLIETVRPDIVIFGHSHRPYTHKLGQILLFNPGSAGPRRFNLPRTVGLLHLTRRRVRTEIVTL